MRIRQLSGQTLGDVADELNGKRTTAWSGPVYDLGLHLEDDEPFIQLDDNEIPATSKGLDALATFAKVPTKFLERVDPDERQWILTQRLERLEKPDVTIDWNDTGIQEVRPARETRVRVADLVDKVLSHLPADATVDQWWNDPEEFRLDVVVPDDWDGEQIGGDAVVGDITKGGVRVGQNRKANLAPWVQPYLLRLACTNGMEVPDRGIKVEARKCTEEEIVALFGHEVGRAFDRVEGDIRAFYDLRQQRLPNGAQAMAKVAGEANLPARTVRELVGEFDESPATMFEIVNAITARANNANARSSSARNLQIAGGLKVYDHSQRCENCFSRLEG